MSLQWSYTMPFLAAQWRSTRKLARSAPPGHTSLQPSAQYLPQAMQFSSTRYISNPVIHFVLFMLMLARDEDNRLHQHHRARFVTIDWRS